MAIKKLTKTVIDSKISEILELQAKIKKDTAELKALANSSESQYTLSKSQKEIIAGINFQAEKIPVNKGAHKYDAKLVRTMLAGITDRSVKKREILYKIDVVEAKNLEALVESGHITKTMLDKARINNYTFKTNFSRIELKAETEKALNALKKKSAAKKAKNVAAQA